LVPHSTFVPLISAAIFFASNGKTYVSYTDSLFLCVSAATMAGLSTVDLSAVTVWQQFILFILMLSGSPVSWIPPYCSFNFGVMP
jgi:Trk-type K+ transport system membrane component